MRLQLKTPCHIGLQYAFLNRFPKGPRAQIIGFEGSNTIDIIVFGPYIPLYSPHISLYSPPRTPLKGPYYLGPRTLGDFQEWPSRHSCTRALVGQNAKPETKPLPQGLGTSIISK